MPSILSRSSTYPLMSPFSSLAHTTNTVACGEFVIQVLLPLSFQPPGTAGKDGDKMTCIFCSCEKSAVVTRARMHVAGECVGAMRLARELGPGKTIVTILCDGGSRYQSKLFNPAFLREKNLPIPRWMQ